jgi:chromosome segregation ATPase
MTAEQSEWHEDTAVTARARLAALQDCAADAYAAITAADAALRALAGRRVAAERELRHAVTRHHAVSRAAAAHARVRPGPLAQLATRFRAGREWRERRAALDAALHETQRPLATARRAVSQVKGEFAAQVHTRAEAVTALRRLTAECASVLEELARATGGGQAGRFPPEPLDAGAASAEG